MSDSLSNFDDLLQQAQRPVLGYLIRQTGSLHSAQDLLQSANLTALAKRHSFTTNTNFVAWLRQIAVNHYRNQVRRESSGRHTSLVDDDLHAVIEERHRLRMEQEQQNNKWHRVTACLDKLPDHQRDVMTRFYLRGQSLIKIAELTGRKPNAIGQTLHRARTAIIQCVKRSPDRIVPATVSTDVCREEHQSGDFPAL